jgi:F5/8 type C domain/Carbohydrate binding domain (family 11)
MKFSVSLFALLVSLSLPLKTWAQDNAITIDNFENQADWQAAASDGVSASKSEIAGTNNKGIRLDYDFNNRSGYAFLRKKLPIEFPKEYEVSFYIRGEGLKNTLELKLSDNSGENVWWKPTRDFAPTKDWQLIKFKKRHFSFAWGPTKDQNLTKTENLEFVIAAGNGGKGFIEIDDLKITPKPARPEIPPPIIANATSDNANKVIDGDFETTWAIKKDDKNPQLTLNLGGGREFGGISLHWKERPNQFDIELSQDGKLFEKIIYLAQGANNKDFIRIKDGEARFIRLSNFQSPANNISLAEIKLEPLSFGEDNNEFIKKIATYYPRGTLTRGFSNEQEFWTLFGADGAKNNGLISEDGQIELGRAGFSIEPSIKNIKTGKKYNWANVTKQHSLLQKYLPIPSVKWVHSDWSLNISAFADPKNLDGMLYGVYEIKNQSNKPLALELNLALRPLQVNGPKQFLAVLGGFSPIHSAKAQNQALIANKVKLDFATPFSKSWTARFLDFNNDVATNDKNINDENGFASAFGQYRVKLQPNESRKFAFKADLLNHEADSKTDLEQIENAKQETANYWRDKLNQVQISANGGGQEIANAMKTNIAYILMMREGAQLKPGTRSYNRSWIRDGAMISETLLRLGLSQEAKDYFAWFSPYQFENGKIPCCADARGSDPVPENDSHGEYLYLGELINGYTRDGDFIRKYSKNILAAYEYMNAQRLSERSAKNQTPGRENLYGLMPPSISHEGYSDKPAYSYWDNFWTSRGFTAASNLYFEINGKWSKEIDAAGREFDTDLQNSIQKTKAKCGINYIAGAADRCDFDATSTTIAPILGLFLQPDDAQNTFDKYWENFIKRRDVDKNWKDYTPYEWRVVSAFTRLGYPERAEAASQYFMNDRMPKEWNAFAEVVGREKRTPLYLGDLPHGWVASDFIRASLDRFAYENDRSEIILGAAIKTSWLNGKGISIKNLATTKGKYDFTMKYVNGILSVTTKKHEMFNIYAIIPENLIKGGRIIFNGKTYYTHGFAFNEYHAINPKQ